MQICSLLFPVSSRNFVTCYFSVFQYETHKIHVGRGTSKTFLPLVFNDVMGLEDGNNSGIHASDIKLAMKGHVKEGHKVKEPTAGTS